MDEEVERLAAESGLRAFVRGWYASLTPDEYASQRIAEAVRAAHLAGAPFARMDDWWFEGATFDVTSAEVARVAASAIGRPVTVGEYDPHIVMLGATERQGGDL